MSKPQSIFAFKKIHSDIKFMSKKAHVYGKKCKYGNPGITKIIV